MVPHYGLQFVGLDRALRTAVSAPTAERILPLTIIIAQRREGGGRGTGTAKHIEPAQATAQQAAQQVGMARVVAEGELGVTGQLALRPLVSFLLNEDRHTHPNPLLARPRGAARRFRRAGALRTVRL